MENYMWPIISFRLFFIPIISNIDPLFLVDLNLVHFLSTNIRIHHEKLSLKIEIAGHKLNLKLGWCFDPFLTNKFQLKCNLFHITI